MYTQRFLLFFCLVIAIHATSFGMERIEESPARGISTTKKSRRTKKSTKTKKRNYNPIDEDTNDLRVRLQTLQTQLKKLNLKLQKQETEKKAVNIDRVMSGFEIDNARSCGHQPTHSRVISHQVHTETLDRQNKKSKDISKQISKVSKQIKACRDELQQREMHESSKKCIIL